VKPWIRRVIDIVIAEPSLPLVNVNLPREPRGLLWTRVSVRHYDGRIVPTQDPQGRELFWFTVKPLDHAEEGTDRWAVEQNWISLTPLRIDLTDEQQLASIMARRPLDRALAAATSPATSSAEAAKAVRAEEAKATIDAAT
jgi:5'-nucleotidase